MNPVMTGRLTMNDGYRYNDNDVYNDGVMHLSYHILHYVTQRTTTVLTLYF